MSNECIKRFAVERPLMGIERVGSDAGITIERVWSFQHDYVPFYASDGLFLTNQGYVILVKR